MSTHISIMNDGQNFTTPESVAVIYALYQTPPPAPVEDEEDVKAAKVTQAKVVTNPGKSAAAKAAASTNVETK